MGVTFEEITLNMTKGRAKQVRNLVKQALTENVNPEDILRYGLLDGIGKITDAYRDGKVYVSEVLIAVQAMNAGMDVLENYIDIDQAPPLGKVVIGTVKGDMHEIGKNLVAMMLRNNGFEVYDLGADVEPKAFVDKAEEVHADIVCISALLTTTMPYMQEVIERFIRLRIREKYTIIVGGAPVTRTYAQKIGADYYSENAAETVKIAKKILLF